MYRKMILIGLLVGLVSTASANSLDSVDFDEMPTAWETGESLEFSVEASGSSIDRMIFQSRHPGEIIFNTRGETYCQNQDTCTWSFDHTENSEDTWEYRFRAYAGEERENSQYREVTFIDNLDYSVSWIERPPSDARRGETVEMSVSATDDADRFDSEGVLKLQFRNDNGEWETFDSTDCSRTSSDSSCSNSGSTEINDREIQDGEADFRGLVEFRGGVTASSDTATVVVERPQSVDRVVIDNLPSQHPEDTDLDLYGEASGTNLDEMILRWRPEDGIQWNRIERTSCSGDYCDITENNYEHSDAEDVQFQVVGRAGDIEKTDSEYVEFTDKREDEVDSVEMDDLPDRQRVDNDFEISGEASGRNLDEITLEKREEDDDWEDVTAEDCNNNNDCDFEYDYDHHDSEEVDFRLRADAGDDTERSNSQTVEFYSSDSIDRVEIEDLPGEYEVDEELDIDASAEGDDLDELIVQESDRDDDDWNEVEDYSCDGDDDCSFTADYTADDEEEKDFRVKAVAEDGDSDVSDVEEVDFVEDPDSVDSVEIDNLPSQHPVDDSLEISGEASGENLDRLEVQERDSDDGDWNEVEDKNCNNDDSCSIETDYTADNEEEKDFRVKAFAGGDSEASDIEEVGFVEDPEDDITSIEMLDLPARHPVGEELEIEGDAEGNSLNEIAVEKKEGGSWSDLKTKDCEGRSDCSIKAVFEASEEKDVSFRIHADTDDDTARTDSRKVTFYTPRGISSVQMNNLPSNFDEGEDLEISGEASGRNLDEIKILTRHIDDISWSTVSSKSCTGDSCSITADYSADNPERREFVVRASAGGDDKFSGIQVVDFREVQQPEVSSVSIDNLPSSHPLDDNLEVSGEASGTQLEQIKLQYREEDSWEDLATESCSGSSCSISSNYNTDQERDVDFRVKASAGADEKFSGLNTVSFEESPNPVVDSVEIDNLPSQHPVDEDLEVSGEASGVQLEEIKIQKNYDNSWEDVEEESCSGSSCSITVDVSEASEKTVDYRVRASAGQSSEVSDTETVEFVEEEESEDPAVDGVTLEELSSTYETDKTLDIEASASGKELESLEILKRSASGIQWSEVESTSCSGSSCTLDTEYSTSTERTMEFVAEASAGDIKKRSGKELVRFLDEDDGDEDEGDDDGEAELDVEVEDRDNNELENVRVEAQNGEDRVRYTNSRGRTNFDLEPGDYEVEASKDGYRTETRDIDLDEGEEEEIRFRLREEGFGVRVVSIDSEASVCEGQGFEVTATLSNIRESDQTVAVYVEGLGESGTETLTIEGEDVEEVDLTVDSVEGLGEKEFTVVAENDGRSTKDKEIEVENCDSDEDISSNTPTGISASVNPRTVLAGETVKITGDIQNVRSSRNVRIFEGNNRRATVSSSRDGRYQAFVTLNSVGTNDLTVRADGVSATRTVEVLPNAHVNPMKAPSTVVQGEEFEVCAEVQSEVSPRVVLEREGKVIGSVNDKGNVCFTEEASEAGDKIYTIRATTSGSGASVSETVRVLEAGNEVESFPGSVTSIETEAGLAKVTLYNKDSSVSSYSLELGGLDSRDVSQTSESVVLAPGESETVYFYFSPSRPGTRTATIDVTKDGEHLESRSISVRAVERPEREIGFLERLNPF